MNIKHEAKTQEEKMIKVYLEENASAVLADKINNGVFIEKDGKRLLNRKSLSSFMKYACDEAKKLAEKGANSACIKDDVVYGWAIHYFEEDSIEGTLYNEDGTEYKKPVQKSKISEKSTYTPTSASSVKKLEPQLSLFDMLTEGSEKCTEVDHTDRENDDEDPSEEELEEAAKEVAIQETRQEESEKNPQPKGTPFYERYKEIALQKPDSIVCYRLGDFYEVLGKKQPSSQTNLNLLSRGAIAVLIVAYLWSVSPTMRRVNIFLNSSRKDINLPLSKQSVISDNYPNPKSTLKREKYY